MTLLESGAAGVPAIATRVGAVSDVIEQDSTGLLCEPGDAAGLADAMIRAAADRTARVRWGERLYQTVRASYSINVQADAIADVYESVLRERARRAAVATPALRAEPTHG
jgi:glycosyltransferase involved in cell wall biosynthesis